MGFLAGQTLTAAALNLLANRTIARAVRSTVSTATSGTTAEGVLRLDDIPVLAGRLYHICWYGHLDTTVAGDATQGYVTYTTDGSTPSVSSTVLDGSKADHDQPDAGVGGTKMVAADYTPATDETLSVLLCVKRISGTGSSTMGSTSPLYETRLWIDDMGEDPGETGTDI